MKDLDDIEQRALAFIDERQLVRDLVEMVGVPSVSGHDAESELLHVLAGQLRALDLDLDLWPLDLPALTSSPQFPGREVPRTEAWGLVATATDSAETGLPALVLQGHVDAVRHLATPRGGAPTRSLRTSTVVGCTVAARWT